jgi:hypothetical protein
LDRYDPQGPPLNVPSSFSALTPYQGATYFCAPAVESDAVLLDSFLRENPMQGWVRVGFSRGPEAHGDPLGKRQLMVCIRPKKEPQQCAAIYALQPLPVYCPGGEHQAVYLSLLRVGRAFRGRIAVLRDGYAAIPYFSRQLGWPDRYFTSIVWDNLPARRLLEAGLKQLPRYTPQEKLHTLVFSTSAGKNFRLLERSDESYLPEIAAFYREQAEGTLYAPVLDCCLQQDGTGLAPKDFYTVRSNGKITACLALWDRRRVRRITIGGYRSPLHLLRPVDNLWARAGKLPVLPGPGEELDAIFIAFAAFSPSAAPSAAQVIREVLYYARHEYSARTAMLGLSARNPLLDTVKTLPHACYTTVIEAVDWRKEEAAPEHAGLVQPEIALL